ncbi:PIH1 domain-containing protein 2 [Cricetulus griseus]|nr:PIH1 domain-containing protein 2 [Cricetulus griseus]
MRASSKGLLTQISQFWNMLDDLAENDPERYKNFIEQELKDGKKLCVDPEPQFCLQTKILKPKEKILFVNLCQWKRIMAPQSATHPVPVYVGRPEDISEASENTLENIRKSTESEPNHLPQVLLTKKQASSDKGRCLIEEISSSEIQVEVKKPAYELKVVKDQNEKPLKIEVKIELPGINSVSLCELSVSEVDLLIEVSEKYRLFLNLPESVNTEMTTAKFVKNKSELFITMPLA